MGRLRGLGRLRTKTLNSLTNVFSVQQWIWALNATTPTLVANNGDGYCGNNNTTQNTATQFYFTQNSQGTNLDSILIGDTFRIELVANGAVFLAGLVNGAPSKALANAIMTWTIPVNIMSSSSANPFAGFAATKLTIQR